MTASIFFFHESVQPTAHPLLILVCRVCSRSRTCRSVLLVAKLLIQVLSLWNILLTENLFGRQRLTWFAQASNLEGVRLSNVGDALLFAVCSGLTIFRQVAAHQHCGGDEGHLFQSMLVGVRAKFFNGETTAKFFQQKAARRRSHGLPAYVEDRLSHFGEQHHRCLFPMAVFVLAEGPGAIERTEVAVELKDAVPVEELRNSYREAIETVTTPPAQTTSFGWPRLLGECLQRVALCKLR